MPKLKYLGSNGDIEQPVESSEFLNVISVIPLKQNTEATGDNSIKSAECVNEGERFQNHRVRMLIDKMLELVKLLKESSALITLHKNIILGILE